MALVIETGAIIADANSYISVVDAQAVVTSLGYTTTITEALLLRAMQVLNGIEWAGVRTVPATQTLPFPRTGVYLSDSRPLGANQIPNELKSAQALLAHFIATGVDPTAPSAPGVKREKVDVIEVEYLESTIGTTKSVYDIPAVFSLLQSMIKVAGISFRIERA